MTANREYEALTTVEAVMRAHAEDREVSLQPPGDVEWHQTFCDDANVIAEDLSSGYKYRAPAASVGDAPSDAVAWRWRVAGGEYWSDWLDMSREIHYREAAAELGHEIEYAYTAPPAAPVVSESDALLIERAKDRRDMLLNWRKQMPAVWYGNSTLDGAAKVIDELLLRLSVPATDDKAPAVDAVSQLRDVIDRRVEELAERLIKAGPKAAHVSASECHEITEAIHEARAILSAAPTSPHDVDAVRVGARDAALREAFYMVSPRGLTAGGFMFKVEELADRLLTAALRKPGEA